MREDDIVYSRPRIGRMLKHRKLWLGGHSVVIPAANFNRLNASLPLDICKGSGRSG